MPEKEPPEVDQSGNDETKSPEVTEIETGIDDSEGFPSLEVVEQKIRELKSRREADLAEIIEDEETEKDQVRGSAKKSRAEIQADLDEKIKEIHAYSVKKRVTVRQAFTPHLSRLNALKRTAESLELLQPTED